MRVLIVDPYYPEVLRSVYSANPTLAQQPYRQQWRVLMDECFGVADFYSKNLIELGHDAVEVIPNCIPLQRRWVEEHACSGGRRVAPPGRLTALVPRFRERETAKWLDRVLVAQAENLGPDAIHFHDPNGTPAGLVRTLRSHARTITAQLGSELHPRTDFAVFDVVFSSFPHYVERLRAMGTRAEYLRLAFEPTILPRLTPAPRRDVAFVGGISPVHADRLAFLEALAAYRSFDWWGYGVEQLSPQSPLRRLFRGPAWGLRMYEILQSTRIALNQHGNVAGIGGSYANNMRLFEATGVGAMLLTDRKSNLGDIFEIGREVIAYSSVEECVEQLDYYLSHEEERAAVARAGQQRTLTEHTYRNRMQEYVEFVQPLLSS